MGMWSRFKRVDPESVPGYAQNLNFRRGAAASVR
jgi:hypothetical protein